MGKVSQIYTETDKKWLPDHACLWRYVPLKTLFFYLTENLFIPSISKLQKNDPFEGRFLFDTEWFNTVMRERYGENFDELEDWIYSMLCTSEEKHHIDLNKDYPNYRATFIEQHYFRFLRKTRYAWCWFLSSSESAAMWNTYGKHGVAIETTVGKVRRVLEKTTFDFEFGQMFYIHVCGGQTTDVNLEQDDEREFVLKPHFLKRREYESEKEVRFVTCGPERPADGLFLTDVSSKAWLGHIRLWPQLAPTEERGLKRVVELLLPGVSCSKSDLMESDHEWFDAPDGPGARLVEVADRKWKEGADHIPEVLKEL